MKTSALNGDLLYIDTMLELTMLLIPILGLQVFLGLTAHLLRRLQVVC